MDEVFTLSETKPPGEVGGGDEGVVVAGGVAVAEGVVITGVVEGVVIGGDVFIMGVVEVVVVEPEEHAPNIIRIAIVAIENTNLPKRYKLPSINFLLITSHWPGRSFGIPIKF